MRKAPQGAGNGLAQSSAPGTPQDASANERRLPPFVMMPGRSFTAAALLAVLIPAACGCEDKTPESGRTPAASLEAGRSGGDGRTMRGASSGPHALSPEAEARIRALREQAIQALASDDPGRRVEALSALEPGNPADLQLLETALLQDPDPAVRREAVALLSFGQAPESVPALLQALADPDPGVVAGAVEALSWHGDDPQVVASLRPLLQHPDPQVRAEAKTALQMMQ